jgi:hypothetical protein
VIVVIGSPFGRHVDGRIGANGTASRIALAAAASGRPVQLVGRLGDDQAADDVVLDLARGGVGHVALLRDPARATPVETGPAEADTIEPATASVTNGTPRAMAPVLDAADVDLGLRYLTDYGVVVLAEAAGAEVVAVVAEATRWGAARLILVVGAGATVPDDLPPDVIVFEAPDDDPDGAFAILVGTFAAALDDGADPADAFRTSIASDGWTEAAPD